MKKLYLLFFGFCLLFSSCTTTFQSDPKIVAGTLQNGINWKVLSNAEPGNRIYLRLAIKAGSVLEDEDQRGVAHLIEHMAFNGTEHFAKNELIDYFESIGMSFGPEVNAYTGFDETVYMLEIPSDDPAMLQTALLVLRDWATSLTFDQEELDKERDVVLEEWRLGRGARGRTQDKQIPFLFNGSKYASRLPIGKPEVIKNITRDRVIDFYKKWYRPENMSVVLVGDADTEKMCAAIQSTLETIPLTKEIQKTPKFSISKQKKPAVMIIRDPEITNTTVKIMEQEEVALIKSENDLRKYITQEIALSIFNNRLSEKTLVAQPQILYAQAGTQRIVRPANFNYLFLVPSIGNMFPALEQLYEELERIKKLGITPSEFKREKQAILDGIEQQWIERNKQSSASLADQLIGEELFDEPMLSIQDRYDYYNKIIPQITLAEVSSIIPSLFNEKGKLVLVTAPENEKGIPDEKALLSFLQEWKPKTPLLAYKENNIDRPLYTASPTITSQVLGSVTQEKKLPIKDMKEWTLSNGAHVIVFPTTYKTNEILFSAFSKGGTSLVSDNEYPSASMAGSYSEMSGLAGFSAPDLKKKLSGKTVSIETWIDESYEGLSGSSSVEDIETLFQLINLEFTQPAFTNDAYQALMSQLSTIASSRNNKPEEAFDDLKIQLLYGDSIRHTNITENFISLINPETAEKIRRERFNNASDFTFVFVGSFDEQKLKKLVETYLSNIPSSSNKEEAKPLSIDFPSGIVKQTLKKGIDPKSSVFISFGGNAELEVRENALFNAMCSLLEIRFRELIREDLGGSYGIGVNGNLSTYPLPKYEIRIEFGCEPGREEALTQAVFSEIQKLQTTQISETYITKLRENFRRGQEEGLKNNQYWIRNISTLLMQNRSLVEIIETEKLINLITPSKMQNMVKKYFHTDNYVSAILMPQKEE